MESSTNTRFVRIINNETVATIRNSKQKKDLRAQWIYTFANTWKNEILVVHSTIPILSRITSNLNNEITIAIVIAPWWPGQPWFTSLMNQSSTYLILGQSSQCLIKGQNMENPKSFLPLGKITVFILDQEWKKDESSQPRYQTVQDFLEELINQQSLDRESRLKNITFTQ
ncbi:MAG: hypothetical protein EZS28_043418 [Streblomastix strix]|uniref:Uncharacterized protein n=1 Tax=Streblomastix strix TaxID=222440 RepID=A0A5J4TUH5_9EUKA|nr:MAG: hypothetical protein EZS28_043418 [Streblomastix strix]